MKRVVFFIILSLIIIALLYMWRSKEKMLYKKQTIAEYGSLFATNNGEIEHNTQKIIAEFIHDVDLLCKTKKSDVSYTDVFGQLDFIQSLSNAAIWHSVCSALEMVHPDETIRTAAHAALEKMGNVFVDKLSNNRKLYELCRQYVDSHIDQEKLSQEQYFFIEHTMKQFKRAGLDADDVAFERIGKLKKELIALGLQFDVAIAQDSSVVHASAQELAGVSAEFVNQLSKNEDGMYQLRLDYPTWAELMSKCTNGQLRQTYYTAFNNRAYPANQETLQTIIQKRNELATLLGYQTFADFDLADQMVGSVHNAKDFLNDLIERC